MLIEKVIGYEGDAGPVTAYETTLEGYRTQLKKIAKYGLNGLGASNHREDLGQRICDVKHALLTMGAYRVCKEWR